ncbi:MAG: NAD-dependent epimerase/dehydratase family protein, partial [Nitrospira sp.]|nr:NAD-dependent epimerase/dehydratase family protein [Nitrospira sp.]
MARIAVTGASGFLGWHVRVYCHARPEHKILQVDREGMLDSDHFQQVIRHADAVVHLAGLNRGNDQDIERVNVELTKQLIAACRQTGARPHVLLANSTHQSRDTAYGRSKRESANMLGAWASETGAVFTDLVIPNVYGEGGRPFYNSVVATFCHQLASGEEPKIIEDGQLELVHAQKVARAIVAAIEGRVSGQVRVEGEDLVYRARRLDGGPALRVWTNRQEVAVDLRWVSDSSGFAEWPSRPDGVWARFHWLESGEVEEHRLRDLAVQSTAGMGRLGAVHVAA